MRFAVLLLLIATATDAATLTYRGCHRLQEKDFKGLSGITHAGGNRYLGILEWDAKIVTLEIALDKRAAIESVALRQSTAVPGRDLEGIAMMRDGGDRVMICDESPGIVEVAHA